MNKDNSLNVFGLIEKTEIDENYRTVKNSGAKILALDKESVFAEISKVREIVRQNEINIIHCAGFKQLAFYYISTLGLNMDLSIVMTERDTARWETKVKRLTSKVTLYITKPNLHILNRNHFKYLQKYKNLYKNIAIIHNSVELAMDKLESGLDLRSTYFNACYIKSIRDDTGHGDIIKLGLSIKESEAKILIHVIGGGPGFQNFIAKTIEHELEGIIVTYGHVEHKKAISMLSEMDLGITTSPLEMMPNFVLECFSVGIPVIGYKTQGIEDLIVDKVNGYLLPIGDIEFFFQKLKHLQKDTKKLKELSANALFAASENSIENIGGQIVEFYKKIRK